MVAGPVDVLADGVAADQQPGRAQGQRDTDEAAGDLELEPVRGDGDDGADAEARDEDPAVLLDADAEEPRLVRAVPAEHEQPEEAEQRGHDAVVEVDPVAGGDAGVAAEPQHQCGQHGRVDHRAVDEDQHLRVAVLPGCSRGRPPRAGAGRHRTVAAAAAQPVVPARRRQGPWGPVHCEEPCSVRRRRRANP